MDSFLWTGGSPTTALNVEDRHNSRIKTAEQSPETRNGIQEPDTNKSNDEIEESHEVREEKKLEDMKQHYEKLLEN